MTSRNLSSCFWIFKIWPFWYIFLFFIFLLAVCLSLPTEYELLFYGNFTHNVAVGYRLSSKPHQTIELT